MSPGTIDTCIDRLRGMAILCRQRWNGGVEDIYREVLTRHPGDASGWDAVKRLCAKGGSLPTGEELSLALRPVRERKAAGPSGPPPCPPARGVRIALEAFRAKYQELHPGKPIPADWERLIAKLPKLAAAAPSPEPLPDEEDPFADPPEATA